MTNNLEGNSRHWVLIIILCLMALSIASDMKLRLWTDELFTLLTARQPDIAELVQATKAGTDGPPPLYDSLVHFLLPVVHNDALAVRLLSTLGIYAMMLGLFVFCRRRLGTFYAFAAAMLALETCLHYATDGRPYGAVMGCTAWALVFWQKTQSQRHRMINLCGLTVCLSLMVALHYFAAFFFGSILMVEIVSFGRERRVDFGILAAVGMAGLVLLAHYPLIVAAAKLNREFWSPATVWMIYPFYKDFWLPILGICAVGIILRPFVSGRTIDHTDSFVPLREWVMLISLTATPAVAIVVSKYTVHGLVDRYILWSVVGMAALTVFAIHLNLRGDRNIAVVIIGVLLLAVLAHHAKTLWPGAPHLREAQGDFSRLLKLTGNNEPILIPNSHTFMELAYYAPASLSDRLYFPIQHQEMFEALSHRCDLHVQDIAPFLSANHRFILLSSDSAVIADLMRSGVKLTPFGNVDGAWKAEVAPEIPAFF